MAFIFFIKIPIIKENLNQGVICNVKTRDRLIISQFIWFFFSWIADEIKLILKCATLALIQAPPPVCSPAHNHYLTSRVIAYHH